MTDTMSSHPYGPKIEIKDPTGPLRSRRARQKRKAKSTVSTVLNTELSGIESFSKEIKINDTVLTPDRVLPSLTALPGRHGRSLLPPSS